MLRGLRHLWVVAIVAATFDIDSTISGIAVKGWAGFGESNHIIRLLYPYLGIWSPVAYLPIEAGGSVVLALTTFLLAVGFLMTLNRGVPQELPRMLYVVAAFPIVAAAGNLLFVLGLI